MARKKKEELQEETRSTEEVPVGDDVAEAQPTIEENTGGGTSGSIAGGLGNAPGEVGGIGQAGNR